MFRAWGRVGTKIGGKKLERYDSKESAKKQFHSLYAEKSGNVWASKTAFVKYPNKFYPLDIDYGGVSIRNVNSFTLYLKHARSYNHK